jgi:kynurenine formamidase
MARQIIDLSLPLENFCYYPSPPEIVYWDHCEGTRRMGVPNSLDEEDFPERMHLAAEKVTLWSHAGTHMDAPYHYGPVVEGKPAKRIDQIPLEWCYGDGVILDLTCKKPGDLITVEDLKAALGKIGYELKAWNIVLLRTDAYKHFHQHDYPEAGPGMGREATLWLVGHGVKVMGIDTYTFDRPIPLMVAEYKSGKKENLYPAHYSAREKECFHMEGLANLDKVPRPFGFKIAAFPIKISRASGAWVRPVAIIEE